MAFCGHWTRSLLYSGSLFVTKFYLNSVLAPGEPFWILPKVLRNGASHISLTLLLLT